jgi:hypothetical protein
MASRRSPLFEELANNMRGDTGVAPSNSGILWVIVLITFGLAVHVSDHISEDFGVRILASGIITLIVMGVLLAIFPFYIGTSKPGNLSRKSSMSNEDKRLSQLFLFVIGTSAVFLSGIAGVSLTELSELFPKVPPSAFLISLPSLFLLLFLANSRKTSKWRTGEFAYANSYIQGATRVIIKRRFFIFLGLFGLCGGSVFAISLIAPQLIVPMIMLLIGVGGVCWLIYFALRLNGLLAKIGIYTISVILSYELWILGTRVFTYWGNLLTT